MDRKHLIKTLESKFNAKAKYLGVPSFAYEITIQEKTYTISREGRLMTASGEEVNANDLLSETSTANETEVIVEQEATFAETMNYEIKLPLESHSVKSLRNLFNMIYAKQALIKKALDITADILTEPFVHDLNQTSIEAIENIESLKETQNYNEQGIQLDLAEKTIALKLELTPSKLDTAIKLFALVNKNALAQNHASFKAKSTTNEKYTFRTWLLRLGMIGEEYKDARKILLKNLSGNAAFRKVSR